MFWIVWKGKGIYIPVMFVAFLYLYYYLFVDNPTEKVINSRGVAASFIATGILCFALAQRWKAKHGRLYFDPKKNKEVILRPDHSFYLLNVYYWSFILVGMGLLCFYFIVNHSIVGF